MYDGETIPARTVRAAQAIGCLVWGTVFLMALLALASIIANAQR